MGKIKTMVWAVLGKVRLMLLRALGAKPVDPVVFVRKSNLAFDADEPRSDAERFKRTLMQDRADAAAELMGRIIVHLPASVVSVDVRLHYDDGGMAEMTSAQAEETAGDSGSANG